MSAGTASKLLQWITTSVRLVVMLSLSIQVMRDVMLGERELTPRRVFGREFWRYLGLSFAIGVGCIVIAVLLVGVGFLLTRSFKGYFGGAGLQLVMWSAIALCVISFVATRLSLLFCHVAIGRSLRWRAAWNDTRGRFWRIIVSHVLAALPVEVGLVGVFVLIHLTLGTSVKLTPPYLAAMVLSLFTCAGLVIGATCACWLYRRLARTLLEGQ
ncbi:hypothetical protein [Paraburkholderia metrosideri]|jgi:hypothetical protein|nr:hypothetical protein [Paraburkholderia metrosideri]